ncbi:MAG: hypothetical protein WCH99_10125 [Verrucomicrobiota bacterium]|jgi:hypothetical protein
MNELQPLLSLLSGKFGWLPTVVAWAGAIKLALAFFEVRFQHAAEDWLSRFAGSNNPDDDVFITKLLSSRGWRLAAFAARFLNFWLPCLADYQREKTKLTKI